MARNLSSMEGSAPKHRGTMLRNARKGRMSTSLYNGVHELERGGGSPPGSGGDAGGVRRARASGPARRLLDGRVRKGRVLSLHSRLGTADGFSAAAHRTAVGVARDVGLLAPDGRNPDIQRQ